MGPQNTVAETRKRYEQYKGNFKATACSTCGVKTPPSWDVDLVSMVHRVGEPFKKVFLLAYTSLMLIVWKQQRPDADLVQHFWGSSMICGRRL